MYQKHKLNSFILILLFIFSIVSCKSKKTEKDILSQKDFINVLVDIHIANATLNYMQADKNWENFKAEDYYPSILKKNHTNKEELRKTIEFYIKYPEKYEIVYDSVINRLSVMQGDITKQTLKEK